MKSNELMIYDWVEYGQYITTVRQLSDKIILSGCVGRLDEVRPVPITPEILIANDIVKGEKNRYYINEDSYLRENNKDGILQSFTVVLDSEDYAKIRIIVRHVHELQHLL